MNKKYLSAILFSAFMIGTVGTFTSCKDYDDDIEEVNKKNSDLSTQLTALQTALATAQSQAAAAKTEADKASQAAAAAKADAIKAAIAEVEKLMKTAPTAEAVSDLASKIAAIETGLNQLVGANDVKSALEQLKIQLDALNKYKALIDANSADIKKVNDAIEALKAEVKAAASYTKAEIDKKLEDAAKKVSEIDAKLATILSKELRSLVFEPELYADGIESLEYPYVLDNYINRVKAAVAGNTFDATTYSIAASEVVSFAAPAPLKEFYFNPVNQAVYHLNPSSATIKETDELSFVSNDREAVTRAGNNSVAAPKVANYEVKNGMLTVGFTAEGKKIRNNTNSAADGKNISIMALQAKIRKAGVSAEDTTITSDYASLYPARVTFENISYIKDKGVTTYPCTIGEGAGSFHIYPTAKEAVENRHTIEVEYNASIELSHYLNIHYDRFNTTAGMATNTRKSGSHKILNYGEEGKYNLEYRYEMVPYTVGTEFYFGAKTKESAYGVVDAKGHFEPRYVDDNGNQLKSDGTTGVSSIGRQPLVRVEVVNKDNGEVVLGGFIKVKIVRTVKPVVAKLFDLGRVPQVCIRVSRHITWSQMSHQILELTGKTSKAEFEQFYKLDAGTTWGAGGVATEDFWATIFVRTGNSGLNNDFTPISTMAAYGNSNFFFGGVTEAGSTPGDANDRLHWVVGRFSLTEFDNIYAQPGHKMTIYVRYVARNAVNEGTVPNIYVPLTLEAVKPEASVEKKIKEYWYTDANANDAGDAGTYQRLNVPFPQDGGNSRNYVVDLDNAFETNAPVPGFNAVKFKLLNNADGLFNSYTDTYFATPVSNWANENGLYIMYQYYFDEPLVGSPTIPARPLTINGKTFKLQSTTVGAGTFKNILVVDGVQVATIDQSDSRTVQAAGSVTYLWNAKSREFLNAISHDKSIANSLCNYANVKIRAFNTCNILLGEWPMKARFLRPIDPNPVSGKEFTDAQANGSTIDIIDLLDFQDWRDVKFVNMAAANDAAKYKNVWLFAFYEVDGIFVDIANITTDMNGRNIEKDLLSGVTTQVSFTQVGTATPLSLAAFNSEAQGVKTTYDAIKAAMGKIRYVNNGNNVANFNVRIPIDVTYYWGTVRSYVTCKVHNTMGN